MADELLKLPISTSSFEGYRSDPDVTDPAYLAQPSLNCIVTKDGKAVTRFGYQAEFSIGVAGKPATSFYHKTYDIAFFALGTKVYYRDFNTNTTVDTGMTLTDGTKTRFSEFNGDVYLTNTTDGPRRIVCMRINDASATIGDPNITVDADGAARLNVFGITSGNLRINGTDEAFVNPLYPYGSITGAADNGSTLIRITTSANHNLTTGEQVIISGVTGTTEANGTWTVTKVDATHFDLQTSLFTNVYVSGGIVTYIVSGLMNIPGNLTASYPDNAIAIYIHNISGVVGIEKPSKIEFWKSRLHLMGFPNAKNADQPNNTVIAGQFVIGQAGATGIELIIDFTYGTNGSTKITVGNGGKLTNILGVDDNLWFMLEDKTYAAADSSVTTTGSGIGGTIPIQKDPNHGCANEDCAVAIGDGEMSYITNDNRIIRQSISTVSGAAVSFADENYDREVIELLSGMSQDKTGFLSFNYRAANQVIYQIKLNGQWFWLIYDKKILRKIRRTYIYGSWQPPQSIAPVSSFFERNGVLYGTDATTDTVYSYSTAFTDNLSPIQSTIATCNFNVGNSMIRKATLVGEINEPSEIGINCYVENNTGGRRTGTTKIIHGSDYTYGVNESVGALPVGEANIAATTPIARWKKSFGVFPSEASRAQLILQNDEDGGYMSLISFQLDGQQSANTFSSSL